MKNNSKEINHIWNSKDLNSVFNIKTSLQGNQVRMNSTQITKGDIFIAFDRGENHDGHKYISDAISKGANICIVNKNSRENLKQYEDKLIKVDNTQIALKKMALYKQNIYRGKIIAITGSAGKTTTKNIIYRLIKSSVQNEAKVFCSYKNFNNILGSQLNLACLSNNAEYAIFEIGMNNFGEIKEITKFIKPDIAIITNIGTAHIGHFANMQEIAQAKSEIFSHMTPQKGIAILNRDMNFFEDIQQNANNKQLTIYTYGLNTNSDVQIKTKKLNSQNLFNVECRSKKYGCFSFTSKLLTDEFIKNIVCGFTTLEAIGLTIQPKTIDCVSNFNLDTGRGEIIKIPKKNLTIIDSSYNVNTHSVKNNLQYIKKITEIQKPLRSVFIMGDMKETGIHTKQLHESLISAILDSKINKYICIGESVKFIYDKLPNNIQCAHFNALSDLIKNISNLIHDGDLILIQGSRKLGMEKIVEYYKDNFNNENY